MFYVAPTKAGVLVVATV